MADINFCKLVYFISKPRAWGIKFGNNKIDIKNFICNIKERKKVKLEGISVPNPQWHIMATAGLIVWRNRNCEIDKKNIAIILLSIFSGVFIDIDHFFSAGLNFFYAGLEQRAIAEFFELYSGMALHSRFNYFHTWEALAIAFVVSTGLKSSLPFLAFSSHMLLDAINAANKISRVSPLPADIYHFFLKITAGF